MQSFRDQKRKARRDLHDALKVPALYRAPGSQDWVEIFVRHHHTVDALSLDGGNTTVAGRLGARREATPKLVFWREEVLAAGLIRLARNATISIEPGVAFTLDNSDPPDGQTVTWYANALHENECMGFPVPGQEFIPVEPEADEPSEPSDPGEGDD